MKITTTRRISQIFFFTLFLWLCFVTSIGERWFEIRGWAVNFFFNIDPLISISTALSTHILYKSLIWSVLILLLTIIFGRFFCGWLCPFGTIHQFVGYIGKKGKSNKAKIELNKYNKIQKAKYYILFVILAMAALGKEKSSLQTGLLDPISIITKTFNIIFIEAAGRISSSLVGSQRFYDGAFLIFAFFAVFVLLNLLIPRFYCRFICPLGALFGIFNRWNIWRITKKTSGCSYCGLCESDCEGACEPSKNIRLSECVLCFNCLHSCKDDLITYRTANSDCKPVINPDISRRGFTFSIFTGLLGSTGLRITNTLGANWNNKLIRPPGAVSEEEFLRKCVKCGQCMRICPTNVIQPAGIENGIESLWTPILNNRIGSSGCQYNCVACGQVCPTAAIRPITLDEKLGIGEFEQNPPVKMGTAFVDRNRCLPWSMGKPCIVCEENCPVSPKAIYTETVLETIRDGGELKIRDIHENKISFIGHKFEPDQLATGDYYCIVGKSSSLRILSNGENYIETAQNSNLDTNDLQNKDLKIKIRLQRPRVDIEKCIGCGICEHECPVSGRKAIRVSAEGETRNKISKLTF
jgi:polyferredoxin/formate hydrogenlyase subunit 6/NADH:ubiquinone oxidoreductase subunit I